jgi:mono/diheme cytochrome c family protein
MEAVMKRCIFFSLAAFGLAACSPPPAAKAPAAKSAPAGSPEMIADGLEIAQTQCAACHVVTADGAQSPRPEAPPFNVILSRYKVEVLAEELVNAIHLGHEDMPTFAFNPQGVDSLIAYLQSIQTQPAKPAP